MLTALIVSVLIIWVLYTALHLPPKDLTLEHSDTGIHKRKQKFTGLIVGYLCLTAGLGLMLFAYDWFFPFWTGLYLICFVLGFAAISRKTQSKIAGAILMVLVGMATCVAYCKYINWPPTDGTAKVAGLYPNSPPPISEAYYYSFGFLDGVFLYRFKTTPEGVESLIRRLNLHQASAQDWETHSFWKQRPYWWKPVRTEGLHLFSGKQTNGNVEWVLGHDLQSGTVYFLAH